MIKACPETNGRTHEPTLRELVLLHDELEKLMNEKFDAQAGRTNDLDRLYNERAESQKEAVDLALRGNKELAAAALSSSELAKTKAETATEKRFELVNEFRAQLADQAATFLPRPEYSVQHISLDEKVNVLAKTVNDRIDSLTKSMSDRMELNIKSVTDSIAGLSSSRDTGMGRSQGTTQAWGIVYAILGLIVGSGLVALLFNRPTPAPRIEYRTEERAK